MKRQFILGINAGFINWHQFNTPRPFVLPEDRLLDSRHEVFPTNQFKGLGIGQGFTAFNSETAKTFIDGAEAHLVLRRREELEQDISVRQIIPYVVLAKLDQNIIDNKQVPLMDKLRQAQIVSYQRTSVSGEARLASKHSIGGGGHMDLVDVVHEKSAVNFPATLACAVTRELAEEFKFFNSGNTGMGIATYLTRHVPSLVGLIRDDSDEVGQVHLGVVLAVFIPADWRVESNEDDIAIGEPATAAVLLSRGLEFENWSQILLEEIVVVGKSVVAQAKPVEEETLTSEEHQGKNFEYDEAAFAAIFPKAVQLRKEAKIVMLEMRRRAAVEEAKHLLAAKTERVASLPLSESGLRMGIRRHGQTFEQFAKENEVTVDAIRRFNRIADDDIDGFVGKPLFLTLPIFVLTQPGDSFQSLALHFGLDVNALREKNPTLTTRSYGKGFADQPHGDLDSFPIMTTVYLR